MRVLVTGATGFAGGHVVPALLDAGHDVRALARGVRAGSLPREAERFKGSVADPAAVRAAAEGCDACVHLVAVITERGEQTFARTNVEGTRNVVRALEDSGARRLVHLSALGAGPDERYPYLRSKWEAENIVRESTLDATIVRPSVLAGPGAGFFKPVVWTLRWMPVYPLPCGGRTKFQPLLAGDLARAVLAALEGSARGEAHDIGGPDTMTFRDMVELAMSALGKRRRLVNVPLWAARPFAYLQQLRREPLVTNQQLDMVVLDNSCDPANIARAFGVEPRRLADSDLRWLAEL
jgi:NADH dehydrogenase